MIENRSKTESIIEIVRGKGQTGLDERIALIEDKPFIPNPLYYRNRKTDEEYSHIAGGIGWPGEKPGFVVVVAVEKQQDAFHVLEEAESPTVNGLLSECLELRKKYGHGQGSDLFNFWYGEQKRFDTFVNDFNYKLRLIDKNIEGIYIAAPYDSQESNAFEIWSNRIQSCLGNASEKKTLHLENCNRLRNHMQNFPPDGAAKGSIEEYPAVTSLGVVVHSLIMLRPWMEFAKREKTVPTIKDDLADLVQREDEQVMRALYGEDDYGGEEYDDGELVSTVDDDDEKK